MATKFSLNGLLIALRGTGTGETKLKAIHDTLKGPSARDIRELIGVIPNATIMKVCNELGVTPEAVQAEQLRYLRAAGDPNVPPIDEGVQHSVGGIQPLVLTPETQKPETQKPAE